MERFSGDSVLPSKHKTLLLYKIYGTFDQRRRRRTADVYVLCLLGGFCTKQKYWHIVNSNVVFMLGQHEKNIGNYKYAIIVVTKYVRFNTPEHSGGYCMILHLSGGGGGGGGGVGSSSTTHYEKTYSISWNLCVIICTLSDRLNLIISKASSFLFKATCCDIFFTGNVLIPSNLW